MTDSPIARTAAIVAKMLANAPIPPATVTVYRAGGEFQMSTAADVVVWAAQFGTQVTFREYAEFVSVFTDLPVPVFGVKVYAHMTHAEARKILRAQGKSLSSVGVSVDPLDLLAWLDFCICEGYQRMECADVAAPGNRCTIPCPHCQPPHLPLVLWSARGGELP